MNVTEVKSDYGIESAKALKKAADNGWEVVVPAGNQLQVDVDCEHDLLVFEQQVELFRKLIMSVIDVKKTPSKSGAPGKYHVTVTLSEAIPPGDRIMYQLLLGSDRKRELLSLRRLHNGDSIPTLFFEKP